MKRKITENNCVFFDLNTEKEDRKKITQIGAIHAASDNEFDQHIDDKCSASSAVRAFIKWLKEVNNGKPVVLIAHNCISFDKSVLESVASENKIQAEDFINNCFKLNHRLEK